MPNKWKNTLTNYNYPSMVASDIYSPSSYITSGDGTVFYTLYQDVVIARQKYNTETGAWALEDFAPSSAYLQAFNMPNGKLLPNPAYTFPVGTSGDGSVLVIAKGPASSIKNKKVIITKYVNGQLIQIGPEITFTPQSNFNTATNNIYFINRVYLSDDGLKLVLVTQGGINTFVCTNDTWTLLPIISDITSANFPYRDAAIPWYWANVSKNGMYMTLMKDAAPYNTDIDKFVVFKFDNVVNNWVLFGEANTRATLSMWVMGQTFISNTGGELVMYYNRSLLRYERNPTTSVYELISTTSVVLSSAWDSSDVFMSGDCNTYACRVRYVGNNNNELFQVLRVLKYSNQTWTLYNAFPEALFPYKTVNQDPGTGTTLIGLSSDGKTVVVRQFDLGNVYIYVDAPEIILSLGGGAVSIQDSTINFNNASTNIKNPISDLNVANKIYVDIASSEIQALVVQDNSYNEQCSDKNQEIESTLAIQIEQLYQYFFNQSRNEPF
jgi:hypothetical protein